MYNDEVSSPDSYKNVPFHYIEIATILLEQYYAYLPICILFMQISIPNLRESEKIRRLVQSIREARFRKTSEGLKAIDGNPLKIDKLAFMEINEIRPFLLGALDQASRLNSLEIEERRRAQTVASHAGAFGKAVGKAADDGDSFYSPSGMVPSSDTYSQTNNPYAYSSY